MKKLLATLGALSIVSSTASVVSCEYANLVKSSIENKIRNYIAISSLLARATVLSQKQDNNTPDGEGLSLKASSQFLYGRNIREYFTRNELPTDNENNTVRQMLGSMFSFGSGNNDVYTVKNGSNFETNLNLAENVDDGRQAQDSFANTFGAIAGIASLLLGNNFSQSQGGFLANALNAVMSLVGNAVSDNDGQLIGQILNFVRLKNGNEEFPAGDYIFKIFQESLKEDDLPNIKQLSFNDVFKIRYKNFWTGLAQILYSGGETPFPEENQNWDGFLTSIKNQTNPSDMAKTALFSKSFSVKFNARLLSGISDLLRFLRTGFVFFHYASQYAMPLEQILPNGDYNHIFQAGETNGYFISKILKEKYIQQSQVASSITGIKPQVSQWINYGDDDNPEYYQVLNIQTLIGFIQNLLSFDNNDPHGYASQRILSLLFSVPLNADDSKDDSAFTLFYDGSVGPFAVRMINLFVIDDGLVNFVLPGMLQGFIRSTFGNSTAAWETGAGTSYSVQLILQTLITFGSKLPPDALEIVNTLLNLVNTEQAKVATGSIPLFEQNWGNPVWGIYGNTLLQQILPAILNLVIKDENKDEKIKKITDLFQNLTKVLTTKFGDILKAFGLDISTLPIFLYGLRDLTITDIINTIANEFDVKRNGKLKDQQKFLLNNYSISDLLGELNENVQISWNTDGSGKTTAEKFGLIDSSGNVNSLFAILLAFGYDSQIADIVIGSESWTNQHGLVKPGFILGIREIVDDNGAKYVFADESILGSLARLYGNNNLNPDATPTEIELLNRPTMQQIINSLNKLAIWFNNVSVPLFVNTFFTPFFRRENWATRIISYKNIEDLWNEAQIIYQLRYYQPNTNKTFDYQVTLKRGGASNNGGKWDEFAAWYINSINRI